MLTTMLKAKLHRARVTHSELEYEGSCAIDGHLLDQSGIHEYEQIHLYNVNTGARLVTYAIRAENHSGIISVNGAAARLAAPGDILIICAYAAFDEQELLAFKPRLIYLNTDNGIERTGDSIPVQRQKQP
ncbi:MAG: aspartate 1-decarboxylase [Methylococcus sp.]|jgi:aspartate 1-decarboxylase